MPNNTHIDELSKTLVKISAKDPDVLGNEIDVQNIQYWLRNLNMTENVKADFIRNIIISYYYANFETFMDLLTIMIFYQVKDVDSIIDIFDEQDNLYFNNYWTYRNWNLIQQNSLKMGQCQTVSVFNISKIGGGTWKFNYNNSDYYNYWSPIEAYINDLYNSITFGLKTTEPDLVASVSAFCYINNTSFINYIREGAKCEEDTCNDVNVDNLFEPERCQHLKDKYQLLYQKMALQECTDIKNNGSHTPVIKDLILFNMMKLALKIRKCQSEFTLPEKMY